MAGQPGGERAAGLPGGAQLAPGEVPLAGDQFMFSTIAFYLHTELVLTNRRLYAMRPNTILGLIPVGTSRANYPIENIAGVSASSRFDVLGVIVGLLAIGLGAATLAIPGVGVLGVILVLVGLAVLIGVPKQAVEVMNSGGGTIRFPVSVVERARTIEYANRVSEALARTGAGTGQAPVLAAPTAPGVDAGAALRRLQDLRDQRLITESEYEAKRTEILARL